MLGSSSSRCARSRRRLQGPRPRVFRVPRLERGSGGESPHGSVDHTDGPSPLVRPRCLPRVPDPEGSQAGAEGNSGLAVPNPNPPPPLHLSATGPYQLTTEATGDIPTLLELNGWGRMRDRSRSRIDELKRRFTEFHANNDGIERGSGPARHSFRGSTVCAGPARCRRLRGALQIPWCHCSGNGLPLADRPRGNRTHCRSLAGGPALSTAARGTPLVFRLAIFDRIGVPTHEKANAGTSHPPIGVTKSLRRDFNGMQEAGAAGSIVRLEGCAGRVESMCENGNSWLPMSQVAAR